MYLVGELNDVGLQLLAGVVVEGALLVHELHHPDLIALHVEVAQRRLLCLELARPVSLQYKSKNLFCGIFCYLHQYSDTMITGETCNMPLDTYRELTLIKSKNDSKMYVLKIFTIIWYQLF